MKRVLRHASRTLESCPWAVLALVFVVPSGACTRSTSEDSSTRTRIEPQAISSPSEVGPERVSNDGGAGAAVRRAPSPSPVPTSRQQAPDASTAPRTTRFVYDSIEDFLTLTGSGPPGALVGYRLGSPDGARSHDAIITGHGRGDAYARRDVDGKVRHISVEFYPRRPDAEGKYGFGKPYRLHGDRAANAKIIAAFQNKLTARWGKSGRGAKRAVWRGEHSELYMVQALDSGGSGHLMLAFDLLPTGGTHVCGPRDGFRAYYKKFRRQLRAALKDKDVAAITTLLDMKTSNEVDPPVANQNPTTEVGTLAVTACGQLEMV